MKTKVQNLLRSQPIPHKLLIYIAIFALIGTTLLLVSRAATNTASFEVENATLSGANKVTDSLASGGQAIQFSSGSTTPPPSTASSVTGWAEGDIRFSPGFNSSGQPVTANIPAGFPNITNTGPIGAGLKYSDLQPTTTTKYYTAGTVIDKKDITGCVKIYASNVIIRKSRITVPPTSDCSVGVMLSSGSNLTLEDVEIVGTNKGHATGLGWSSIKCIRCNVHGFEDGISISHTSIVEDSFIWGLAKYYETENNDNTHNDTIQTSGNTNVSDPTRTNVQIRRNTLIGFYQTSTSAIRASTYAGYIKDLIVEDNFMYGGSYTIYVERQTNVDVNETTGAGSEPINSVVRNNIFEKGSTGLYGVCISTGKSPSTCNTRPYFIDTSGDVTLSGNKFSDGTLMPGG